MSSTTNTDHGLDIEREGSIAWIVLNRPERLNALNDRMLAEYKLALNQLAEDVDTRVIIVRGNGRAFCAGYDISSDGDEIGSAEGRDVTAERLRLERIIDVFMTAWKHPKPVISAVHGYCLAGGTQLATLTDITVVAKDAQIGTPSIPLGGGFISPMWVPLVGPKRAKQFGFQTGPTIDGATAADWGWANYAVDGDELLSDVRELALRISRIPADLITAKKAAINRAAEISQSWQTIMPLGAETDALLHHASSVERLGEQIRVDGLKETLKSFQNTDRRDRE